MNARAQLWRASQRMRRRASLPDSLLCGTLPAYLASRLRPLFVYRLLGLAAHLTELFLLARLIPDRSLLGSVALHNLCALGAAFFWGALEPVREKVRRLANPAEGSALAAPLLSLALGAGALLIAAAALACWRSRGSLASLYAGALLLRLALEVGTRALQIPIAARSRVFRPPAWLLARPLVAPLVLLAGFGFFGARALPLSVAVAAIAQSAVTGLYTLRCLRRKKIPAPRPRLPPWTLRALRLAPRGADPRAPREAERGADSPPLRETDARRSRGLPSRALFAAGLAAALPLASSLLVCALIAEAAALESQRARLLALHALVPLFLAAAGWAQLFYVDLHWLARPWRAAMLRRFESALERAAPLVGLALAPWCALIALLTHHHALGWSLACAPLLAAQSWLAALQLGLFVRGRASALAWSGLGQALGTLAAAALLSRLVPLRGPGICILCAALQLLAGLWLRRARAHAAEEAPLAQRKSSLHGEGAPEPLSLEAWSAALARVAEPVCAGSLAAPGLGGARLSELVARLEAIAGRPHVTARAGESALLFWTPASRAPARSALLAAGAGLIRRLTLFPPCESGPTALASLERAGLARRPAAERPGEHIDLARGRCPDSIRALSPRERRRLLLAAERSARGLRRLPGALPAQPAADCDRGILTGIRLRAVQTLDPARTARPPGAGEGPSPEHQLHAHMTRRSYDSPFI